MDLGENILNIYLRELALQGHKNTGKLARDSYVRQYGDSGDVIAVVQVVMPDYAGILDKGVRKGKVPFGSRRGKGGNSGGESEYIGGLMDWLQDRYGYDDKEARSRAIRIGKVASKQGHPTKGSYAYSQNGKRTGFTAAALGQVDQGAVDEIVTKFVKKRLPQAAYDVKVVLKF